MNQDQFEQMIEAINGLSSSIGRIASGQNTPDGLEALAISVAGEGLRSPLGDAIECAGRGIAEALEAGLSDIATAIEKVGSQ